MRSNKIGKHATIGYSTLMNRIHLNTEAIRHKVNHGPKKIITKIKTMEDKRLKFSLTLVCIYHLHQGDLKLRGVGKGVYTHFTVTQQDCYTCVLNYD